MGITIFTPTYNRVATLPRLYNSLLNQNNKNFEWLIVDDGSCDNTRTLIENWIKDNKITIRYIYQENSGKMSAHNNGVLNANYEIFMCVDSDDYLYDENVVNTILSKWYSLSVKEKKQLAGIIAQKFISNKNFKNKILPNIYVETLSNIYRKYKFKGDTALIFRTEVLKDHLFPIISGEKFITEAYVYEQIDEKYKYLVLPINLFNCEYMPDGYTNNWINTVVNNPKGWKLYCNQHMIYNISRKDLILTVCRYISMCLFNNDNIYTIINSSNKRMLTILLLPLGWIKYLKDYKLYKSQNNK